MAKLREVVDQREKVLRPERIVEFHHVDLVPLFWVLRLDSSAASSVKIVYLSIALNLDNKTKLPLPLFWFDQANLARLDVVLAVFLHKAPGESQLLEALDHLIALVVCALIVSDHQQSSYLFLVGDLEQSLLFCLRIIETILQALLTADDTLLQSTVFRDFVAEVLFLVISCTGFPRFVNPLRPLLLIISSPVVENRALAYKQLIFHKIIILN